MYLIEHWLGSFLCRRAVLQCTWLFRCRSDHLADRVMHSGPFPLITEGGSLQFDMLVDQRGQFAPDRLKSEICQLRVWLRDEMLDVRLI